MINKDVMNMKIAYNRRSKTEWNKRNIFIFYCNSIGRFEQ